MKYCIRCCYIFLMHFQESVLCGGDFVSTVILMFLLSMTGVLFVCAHGWRVEWSGHLTFSCPDKIRMIETFLSPDKPQRVFCFWCECACFLCCVHTNT